MTARIVRSSAMRCIAAAFCTCSRRTPARWAAHAYAQFGDIKYPAGFSAFRVGQSERAQRRRHRSRSAAAHHQLRQVQPVHAQRHGAARALEPSFSRRCSPARWTSRRPPTACSPKTSQVAPDRLSATFRLQPGRALPRRQAGHGRGREAQLRHAHEQAGGAAVPRGLRRREPRRRRRPPHRALRVQERRAPSCRCWSAACRSSAASGAPASRSTRSSWTCRSRPAPTGSAA